ncbi:hypothetical protein [Janthinobacterium sp. BJB401]|uniref:hypothetical protein n=1 Tax=Janthinobacterium sp. BJB401 TaxID=2745934 RepID=UPI00159619E7|nr:hypothetical protein [Janthinobacterium sp. BJB401]NVI82705.1 hypothetical protein [Janthinobacterium sp. BJB401]
MPVVAHAFNLELTRKTDTDKGSDGPRALDSLETERWLRLAMKFAPFLAGDAEQGIDRLSAGDRRNHATMVIMDAGDCAITQVGPISLVGAAYACR